MYSAALGTVQRIPKNLLAHQGPSSWIYSFWCNQTIFSL